MLDYCMIQKRNWLVLALIIVVGGQVFAQEKISIASFNLRIFGQSKAEKEPVLKAISEIIKKFDIIAIQEIRDKEETAILLLMNEINKETRSYDYLVGPRLGRTSSKEQYAFIYRNDRIKYDYFPITWNDDEEDIFEREPYLANFYTTEGTFDFVLINIHTKPEDAQSEIKTLPRIMKFAEDYYGEEDVICLGDFNADGSYYNEENYRDIFPVEEYIWIITNEADTNVAKSDRTYDRIAGTIATKEDYGNEWGVLRFDEIEMNGSEVLNALDISDHYPIWAKFYTNNDTD